MRSFFFCKRLFWLLYHIWLIQHWLPPPLTRKMATRRLSHASHWALLEFRKYLIPFIKPKPSQITQILLRPFTLPTAISNSSHKCRIGLHWGNLADKPILAKPSLWRKVLIALAQDLSLLQRKLSETCCIDNDTSTYSEYFVSCSAYVCI